MKKFFLLSLSILLLAALDAEAKNCNGVGRCGDDGSNGTVESPAHFIPALKAWALKARRPGRWHVR